jgi:predicted exporter
MDGSLFLRLFSRLERRRNLVIGLLLTLLTLAGLSLVRVRFDNTLDLMLPTDSPAQRMMAFLRTANFSNKIVISLEAKDTEDARGTLIEASDSLVASLQSPLISKVISGFSAPDLMADAGFFLRYAPQILTASDLASIDSEMNSGGISGVVQRLYYQLLKPEGMFMARAIRSDPLAINQMILGRLEKLSTSMGYDVTMENGHFISRDGRHTMLLLETVVPLTDAAGARKVLKFLTDKLGHLPAGITGSLVCGHTHVVSNEDTIQRDLGVVLSLASVAFIILYVGFFRDKRALLIFLVPALAAVVALAITALLFPRLSYFVIAFGPVIAGIADDYGIAVYVAIRHGSNRAESVRHIVSPVTAGALTTTAIFFAFFFSRIPGYYQLAWFCILSLLLTVVLALYVLPLFLKPGKTPEEHDDSPSFEAPRHLHAYLAVIAVLFILAAILATRVKFDSDITRLDGTAPAILKGEDDFRAVWGTGERKEAILAVMGNTYEEVREKTDAIYEDAVAAVGATQFVSLASVWPSGKTRADRARAWTAFWRDGREVKFRGLLAEQGAARGFATNAFEPFFEHLYDGAILTDEPVSNQVLVNLKDRFVQTPNGRYQTLSFFPDTPEVGNALGRVVKDRTDAFIVSRAAMGSILSDAFTGEVMRTSMLAGVLIILTAWLFIRSIPLTLIALSPAFSSVVGLLAIMGLMGRPLTVANLISGIVVFGLSIDFGMHILHACRHPQGLHARMAVTFAAITTVMGAAVLLFARHPALYSIGLTLTIGVTLGYVAAMWMVPVLYGVMGGRK